MRACIQRVSEARVSVAGEVCGSIGLGLLVLLGVAQGDTTADATWMSDKIAGLRVFEDEQHKMNLAVTDVGGAVLVVSQFTLLGDCRKGRRPSFAGAASPELAQEIYELVAADLRRRGLIVATGRFRQMMQVALVNDGPVTLLLDSRQ